MVFFHINLNAYYNQSVYSSKFISTANTFGSKQDVSGNIKWNNTLHLTKKVDAQLTAVYLAPDIIPQGKINQDLSIDLGLKKISSKW
jgi:hypothetical protein